ncbi:amidohydrolase family protein [Nocardioides yefusunii]|uniref:Amidohydrolase family protein n=1 Tax=Nocardioides yefusunii TaxID=2500546 RepID=A0ABW1QSX0_9ACTN|nr:amidohydrolase family protein [Nocardioides yefusunii]
MCLHHQIDPEVDVATGPGHVTGAALDADVDAVRAWTARHGLPGLVDIHAHLLPPRVFRKVREQFDAAGPLIGRPWPLRYRDTNPGLVEILRRFGVQTFSALPYAHRPGMAEFLNDWAAAFAAEHDEVLRCGTFFPEPDGSAASYVAERIASGLKLFKVHVQVGAFHVTDPLIDDAWGVIAEAGTPVVLHAGSGPIPTEHTGPGPVAELLRRHPRLRLVIAHAGAPEYREFLDLAVRYEHVGLDTTMAFTPYFDEMGGIYPPDLVPALGEVGLAGKVFLGSDFPNIPYPYVEQLDALERLGLGERWLRAVCRENVRNLFGIC